MVNELDTHRPGQPVRRAVILGASNVTKGLSSVVDTARRAWGQPLEILAAIGHGRSYGLKTNVLGRGLPGIVRCGLWDELQTRPPLPTAALVTDIGNDLVYGCSLRPITRWLETCLQRLADQVERLVITRPPVDVISEVPEWKLRLLTSLVFPGMRFNRGDALAKAFELDDQLLTYASRFGAYVVQPETAWYTWDPIHVARRHRSTAWQKYLSCWSNGQPPSEAARSFRRWLALGRARPLEWTCFGFQRRCRQPTVQLFDGTTISLF